MGPAGSAEILGTDNTGLSTIIRVKASDINAVAAPLLCASAITASPNAPPSGTGIGQCHLPVLQWQTGRSNINQEGILLLTVSGGLTLAFQFPPQGAQACGQALVKEGQSAGLQPGQRPN
jgi:hypothetical protein